MKLEENIELILELWKCKNFGEHAKTNPSGATLCKYKEGGLCEYQFKDEGECYCSRWNK